MAVSDSHKIAGMTMGYTLLESADHARSAMQSAHRLRKTRPLFDPTGAVRGAVCDRSPRKVCAQTTHSLRADNAQSQCVVWALTTCSNSKISKKKKGTLHNVCMYYSIDGFFFIILLHFTKVMS
jgi:hypothetical protein